MGLALSSVTFSAEEEMTVEVEEDAGIQVAAQRDRNPTEGTSVHPSAGACLCPTAAPLPRLQHAVSWVNSLVPNPYLKPTVGEAHRPSSSGVNHPTSFSLSAEVLKRLQSQRAR